MLGPLLLILFLRDLPEFVDDSCVLFADDTLMYDVHKHDTPNLHACCRLSTDVEFFVSWADLWDTVFNVQKSAELRITRRRRKVHMDAQQLTMPSGTLPLVTQVIDFVLVSTY